MNCLNSTVAQNIALARKEKRLSQQQLSDRIIALGGEAWLVQSSISKIENNQLKISMVLLEKIALALDLSPVSLLCEYNWSPSASDLLKCADYVRSQQAFLSIEKCNSISRLVLFGLLSSMPYKQILNRLSDNNSY